MKLSLRWIFYLPEFRAHAQDWISLAIYTLVLFLAAYSHPTHQPPAPERSGFISVVGFATKQASLAIASDTRLNSCATLTLGNAKETALWFNPVYGDLYLLQELPESSGNLLP